MYHQDFTYHEPTATRCAVLSWNFPLAWRSFPIGTETPVHWRICTVSYVCFWSRALRPPQHVASPPKHICWRKLKIVQIIESVYMDFKQAETIGQTMKNNGPIIKLTQCKRLAPSWLLFCAAVLLLVWEIHPWFSFLPLFLTRFFMLVTFRTSSIQQVR